MSSTLIHIIYSILGTAIVIGVGVIYFFIKQYQKLKYLIDTAIEGMVISENQRIVQINEQALRIVGIKHKNDVMGKSLFHFVDDSCFTMIQESLKQEQTQTYECLLKRHDGTPFPALVKGSTIHFFGKSLRVSALIDLSELKEAQYALQAMNETLEEQVKEHIERNRQQEMLLFQQSRHAQMGEMISMIAHQWRQPLNVLSLLSQNIIFKYRLNKLDDASMNEFKEDSMRQVMQMSKTIDDFRDFFKPDKTKKRFDVKEQLSHTVEMIKPILAGHGIELSFHAEDALMIEGFPNEFGQSIINILNNAKDVLLESIFEQPKRIRVDAKRIDAQHIMVCIEDNGGGIEERVMPHIFEPYFSTKTTQNGTGLGLYMTKMIIEEHMGGVISVTNTLEGAQFKIVLQG